MLFKNLVCIWKVSNMNVIVHLLDAAPKNDIEMHFVIQFRLHLFRNQRLCINVQTAKTSISDKDPEYSPGNKSKFKLFLSYIFEKCLLLNLKLLEVT